jgi:hypothetical protein
MADSMTVLRYAGPPGTKRNSLSLARGPIPETNPASVIFRIESGKNLALVLQPGTVDPQGR